MSRVELALLAAIEDEDDDEFVDEDEFFDDDAELEEEDLADDWDDES